MSQNQSELVEDVTQNVLTDYFEFMRTAFRNDWHTIGNKTVAYGKFEQPLLQHSNNGVQAIFSIFEGLPDDHHLATEEMLRASVALYALHDYHKKSYGREGEFDISVEEAEAYARKMGIERIWPSYDGELIRAVMAAHHMGDESSLKNTLPNDPEDVSKVYFVLVADALASTTQISEINESVRKRIDKLLFGDYSAFVHTVDRSRMLGQTSSILNQAVSDVLEQEGFIQVRVYEEGVLYLRPSGQSVESVENLNTRVLDEFRKRLSEAHPKYTSDAIESSSVNESGSTTDYYALSYLDVLMRGSDDTIRGVLQKAVSESSNPRPVTQSAEEGIDTIEDATGVSIHTGTRRVEGLAKGVHTIHRYVSNSVVVDDSEAPEWKRDPLMATLHLFGLYENDDVRETVTALQNEHHERLTSGDSSVRWGYKYLVAQYIGEEYFVGRNEEKIAEYLAEELVLSNLQDFDETSLDELFISHILSELLSYSGMTVNLGGGKDAQNLSSYRDNDEPVREYHLDGEKTDCELCSWGTTAENPSYLLPTDRTNKTIERIDEMGETKHVDVTGPSHKCFACQLEIVLRSATIETWGDDDTVVYAYPQTEYGFVPVSWWMFTQMAEEMRQYNELGYSMSPLSEEVVDGSTPTPIQRLFDMSESLVSTRALSNESACSPLLSFNGRPIPIANLDDKETLYESLLAFSCAALYSGVRVGFSTEAMSAMEYETNAMVSFSDRVEERLPVAGEEIPLTELGDFVEAGAFMHEIADTLPSDVIESNGNSPFSFLAHLSDYTAAPASRLTQMAVQNGFIDGEDLISVAKLDEQFGDPERLALYDELGLYISEAGISPSDYIRLVNHIAGKNVSSVEMLMTNLVNQSPETGDDRYARRMANNIGRCTQELADESESLISIARQAEDRIRTVSNNDIQ